MVDLLRLDNAVGKCRVEAVIRHLRREAPARRAGVVLALPVEICVRIAERGEKLLHLFLGVLAPLTGVCVFLASQVFSPKLEKPRGLLCAFPGTQSRPHYAAGRFVLAGFTRLPARDAKGRLPVLYAPPPAGVA